MKIGILGCAGRMGRSLLAAVSATEGCVLAGGAERPGHPALGRALGPLFGGDAPGLVVEQEAEALIARADAVIEFSTPEASLAHAGAAARHGTAHVIGTTGLDAAQAEALRAFAERTPIVWSANMSQGVALLTRLVERVARALGPEAFDVEIVESHHRHKTDAPSGTALALGRAAAAGRGVVFEDAARLSREGLVGPRPAGEIGFATVRGGDVVGEHDVVFAGEGERIVLRHVATDRAIFARGALRAALWTEGRPPGLYGMADVLGLAADGGG